MHPTHVAVGLLAALALVPVVACGSSGSDAPGRDPTAASSSGSSGGGDDASTPSTSSGSGGLPDGGSPSDAAGGDAKAEADAAIDSGPIVISDDPFDPLSCAGPTLTYAQAVALFSPGASIRVLGNYVVMHRSRTCNPVTGCSAWSGATQATAAGPHDAVTGGFATAGVARLEAPEAADAAVQFVTRLIDASSSMTYPAGTSQFQSQTTSGALAWPEAAYMYTALDNRFIPALYVPEPLPGRFVASPLALTVTSSCLRAASTTALDATDQYALLVRF